MQNYALGFATVIGSGSEKKGRMNTCVYIMGTQEIHDAYSLEDRKRETKSRAKDCEWMCFLSLKKIKGSGEAHKGWVLTVKELKREHNLSYQMQLAEATNFRSTSASYT